MTLPIASGALAIALTALAPAVQPAKVPAPTPLPTVYTVKEQVQKYFADAPIMVAIAGCESHYRQFDNDGSVFRGEQNHLDVGVMQINERYHLEASKALGYDIHTIEGNMAYGRYLYEHEGTAPWISSSYCWNKDGTQLTYGPVAKIASAITLK